MSMFILVWGAIAAQAHEISATVGDITVSDENVLVELRLALETFIAGIDQTQVADTDDADGAADYDALRLLTPEDLKTKFDQYWPVMSEKIVVSDGSNLPLTLVSVDVPNNPITDMPRLSTIAFEAQSAGPVTVTWPADFGTLILRQQGVDNPYTDYLWDGATSEPISVDGVPLPTFWETLIEYIPVGFDHIIPKGLDHILFVLGLFFLAARLGPLLWQVTAFTLAHTVTLALGALGLVNIPGHIVEPLIAASIVFVAVENIMTDRLSRWRPAVIFAFGLLHGLGFASVLGDFGLPEGQFISALIGFNIGVEVGQLTVIAVAFLAVGLWFRDKPWYRRVISIPASIAIAIIGIWWCIERVFL